VCLLVCSDAVIACNFNISILKVLKNISKTPEKT
jgi:hypothetical protein